MTWEYVAGFFDGEGSVHYGRTPTERRIVRVTFTQGVKQNHVLYEIQEFLESYDIKSGMNGLGTKLRVSLPDIPVCLEYMLPHLIVKREKATECLAFLRR